MRERIGVPLLEIDRYGPVFLSIERRLVVLVGGLGGTGTKEQDADQGEVVVLVWLFNVDTNFALPLGDDGRLRLLSQHEQVGAAHLAGVPVRLHRPSNLCRVRHKVPF